MISREKAVIPACDSSDLLQLFTSR